MKNLAVALFFTTGCLASAQSLSEGDRQALLERLAVLQEEAGERAVKKAGSALLAYRTGSTSDSKAYELFLDCVEEVRFVQEKREGQGFREWKRKHDDVQDSKAFRRAIRHELAWLALMLEYENADEAGKLTVTGKMVEAIDKILADGELLREQFGRMGKKEKMRGYDWLAGKTMDSVFAKAYSMQKPDQWPESPLKLEDLYRKIIIPTYTDANDAAKVRQVWSKWMAQEAKLAEMKGNESETGGRSAAYDKFVLDRR
ncbi:MAG: hypothetical protein Q7Q71_06145, partial [Verrucomicrobiota bacterium JB023]|nr:hypothetical protein [Verrucomicrobiota bacterium JB023]